MSTSSADRSGTGSPTRASGQPSPQRLDLGVAQVTASALAAVTSAVAASTLGVAGTIVGAGLGAVVATVGSAVYAHSLRRAGARLRELRPVDDGRWPALRPQQDRTGRSNAGLDAGLDAGLAAGVDAAVPGLAAPVDATAAAATGRQPRQWRRAALVVGTGFGLALGVITGAEALIGHPLSSSSETGTTVGRAVTGSGGSRSTPATTSSPTTSSPTTSTSATTPSTPLSGTTSPTATASVVPPSVAPSTSAPSASVQQSLQPTAPGTEQPSQSPAPAPTAPASSAPEAPANPGG
jgi:hypothetical protein